MSQGNRVIQHVFAYTQWLFNRYLHYWSVFRNL